MPLFHTTANTEKIEWQPPRKEIGQKWVHKVNGSSEGLLIQHSLGGESGQ